MYYRQPQPFTLPAGLSESEERFARVEARFGLGGLLSSLSARWVPGPPGRVADSEYKPLQLATAARCSLPIASTVLTNNASFARSFTEAQDDGAVYKAMMHKVIADSGSPKLIYTSRVHPKTLDERVGVTMHQFQANLAGAKAFDVRILATQRGHAAVAIHTDDLAARQDFRIHYEALTYSVIDVPDQIATGCSRYLDALDLRFGVFDFCVTNQGWYFLECGAGAQWAWLEEVAEVPMAELVADALIGETS